MKKATIQDIAKEAQVSPASVSMILNKKSLSRFSDETIQKVYQISRKLGYQLKSSQKHKNQRQTILIICPSVMNPYYATLIQGMEQEARTHGYLTMIFTTYWDKNMEQEISDQVIESNISGIIYAMIPQQPAIARELANSIPIVAVGDRASNLRLNTVEVNNYEAGQTIAKHLIGLNHQHIAYISTGLNSEHSSRVNRYEGLRNAYAKLCPEGTVTIYSQDVPSQKEMFVTNIEHDVGYNLTQKCLEKSPQVTAIVAMNDMIAYGVIDALNDSQKQIPGDISVCGFDNIYPSRFHPVDLTTIEHSIEERGRSSARLLIDQIKQNSELSYEEHAITRVEYQSRLIERSSTGKAKKSD